MDLIELLGQEKFTTQEFINHWESHFHEALTVDEANDVLNKEFQLVLCEANQNCTWIKKTKSS